MHVVTLFAREGCHLCDDARAALKALRAELPFVLEERDIEADDELHARYLERVPVIALDGKEHSDFWVDVQGLREGLATGLPTGP